MTLPFTSHVRLRVSSPFTRALTPHPSPLTPHPSPSPSPSTLTKFTIELRNPRPRELMNKYLARNQDALRQKRRATAATAGAAPKRSVAGFAAVSDWAAEAERIGASQPAQYSISLVADNEAAAYSYVFTGNALWSRATGDPPHPHPPHPHPPHTCPRAA